MPPCIPPWREITGRSWRTYCHPFQRGERRNAGPLLDLPGPMSQEADALLCPPRLTFLASDAAVSPLNGAQVVEHAASPLPPLPPSCSRQSSLRVADYVFLLSPLLCEISGEDDALPAPATRVAYFPPTIASSFPQSCLSRSPYSIA